MILLVSLLILTPPAWASTAETWTDGIYDYESDELVQVIAYDYVAVVHSRPIISFAGVLVIVARLVLPGHIAALEVIPSASQTRAPPALLTFQ